MSPAWYSASDFLQAAAQERARLGKELERLRALRREHEGRRAEVERRRDETGGALAAALLPTLGPAELQQAVKLTGAVWLVGDDVIAARRSKPTRAGATAIACARRAWARRCARSPSSRIFAARWRRS